MCCKRLAENTKRKNEAKNRHLRTIAQICWDISLQLRHVSAFGKKLVKQQYVLHMYPQYCELRPINCWDLLASLGHPSKFWWVSHLAFVSAATSLTGGQPNFAQYLVISWAATLYIHFRGLLPLTEFCRVENSSYVQVLRSRILAALLHGTPAAGVSQTLRHGTRNGVTQLSQWSPILFGRVAITLDIGPHSSCFFVSAILNFFCKSHSL